MLNSCYFQDEETQAHFSKKKLDPTRTRDKKKKSNDCPKGSGSTAHNSSEVIDALLLTSLAFKSLQERLASTPHLLLVNEQNIKVRTLLDESPIEHAFGDQTSRAQGMNATLEEYIYAKRKIESKFLMQQCRTDINFTSYTNKLYHISHSFDLHVTDVFDFLRKMSRSKRAMTVTQSTRKTQSDKNIIKMAVKMTKGSKTQSRRVIQKVQCGSRPTFLGGAIIKKAKTN